MTVPEMIYLRKLLGDAWIATEVLDQNSKHWLGLWQKQDPNNLWITYTETLVKSILTSENIKLDREPLANKLKSRTDFVSTLAEMETATYLAAKGFGVTIEPTAPRKGPDLRADWEGVSYFVEVRTVGFSENEERRELVSSEIFTKLNTVPSSYRVGITAADEYASGSQRLRDAIAAVVTSLGELKNRELKEAKLYYAGKNQAVLVFPGAALTETHYRIMKEGDFTAEFYHLGKECSGTPTSFLEARKNPLEPVNDHRRLKRILDDKREQLPQASRGIIVLEVSALFMLSDFSIERALYGDLIMGFPRVVAPEETVGEAEFWRNTRGFLLHTSRVSAVVIHRRKVEDGTIKNEWRAYPTNRANADTIRLTSLELERLGDLGDFKHLSAEHAPEQDGSRRQK